MCLFAYDAKFSTKNPSGHIYDIKCIFSAYIMFMVHIPFKQPNNFATTSLEKMGFQQVVTEATHIEGGAIDHIYISQGRDNKFDWDLELYPKYYSDHDGISLTTWNSSKTQ